MTKQTSNENSKSKLAQLRKNVIAGGIAGISEICVMYPTDVVKTRQQLNTGKTLGVFQTMRTLVQAEGMGVLYRGIASPIIAEAPKRAWKFTANQEFRDLYRHGDGTPIFAANVLAGASAGATEALVNCPAEVVKVRQQAPEGKMFTGTLDAIKQIVTKEGVFALYRGFEAQVIRNALWNGTYFACIPFIKSQLPDQASHSSYLQFAYNFGAGVIGGTLATAVNTPADVVKSRLQNMKGTIGWTIPTMMNVAQQEGIGALYKGFGARILRLGPGGGIMMAAFSFISNLLE